MADACPAVASAAHPLAALPCPYSPADPAPASFSRNNLRLRLKAASGGSPGFTGPPDFSIDSEDGSTFRLRMSGASCSLRVRLPGARLWADCVGPPLLWSRDGFGPEGTLALHARATARLACRLLHCLPV